MKISNEQGSMSQRITPRGARLFVEAGLLSDSDWKSLIEKTRRNKHLVEVLKQDAFSLGTFRDLFFEAEINPFKLMQGKAEEDIGAQLTQDLEVRESEWSEILTRHGTDFSSWIPYLERIGAARAEDFDREIKRARKEKQSPGLALLRAGLLTHETARKFLSAPENPLKSFTCLFQSLAILEHNRLLSNEDVQRLQALFPTDSFSADEIERIRAEIRATVKLNSAQLLEKIEVGLEWKSVGSEPFDACPQAMSLFPESLLRRRVFMPISSDERVWKIAVADPLDLSLAVLIRWVTGKWAQCLLSPPLLLQERIKGHFERTNGIHNKSAVASDTRMTISDPPESSFDHLSAVQLVGSIIERAVELKATDIHFEPRRAVMVVRFRVDGLLTTILNIPPLLMGPVVARVKVLANMDVTERRRPQDGRITLNLKDRHFDFRVATLPTLHGESVAIRILDSSRVMTGISQIGMNPAQLKILARLIRQPSGMILVTGPTGSGKTSTLYAALSELNDGQRHIVTIEDPVEYQIEGINQSQMDPSVELTFSEGLRAILRQDPNVIMVGEIRDSETAAAAIRAALTGHLVFSTLHTHSALGAFQALGHLGVSTYMIGSSVTGVIAQRLVRKLCGACKKLRPVSKAIAAQFGVRHTARLKWHVPVGCDKCLGSGYSGRMGVFELVEMSEPLRLAVLEGGSPAKLEKVADAQGRVSIHKSGIGLLSAGITSADELVNKVLLDA